jgi:hypothetical protein
LFAASGIAAGSADGARSVIAGCPLAEGLYTRAADSAPVGPGD